MVRRVYALMLRAYRPDGWSCGIAVLVKFGEFHGL
jgi:hypothetical protein